MRRTLYYGDNLDVMRGLPTESVDLMRTDARSKAMTGLFDDTTESESQT